MNKKLFEGRDFDSLREAAGKIMTEEKEFQLPDNIKKRVDSLPDKSIRLLNFYRYESSGENEGWEEAVCGNINIDKYLENHNLYDKFWPALEKYAFEKGKLVYTTLNDKDLTDGATTKFSAPAEKEIKRFEKEEEWINKNALKQKKQEQTVEDALNKYSSLEELINKGILDELYNNKYLDDYPAKFSLSKDGKINAEIAEKNGKSLIFWVNAPLFIKNKKFRFKFGKINGTFWVNDKIISLEGAPQYVEGSFNCYNNDLVSLEGAPQYVGEDFRCSGNKLVSLKGCPKEVDGDFYCRNNKKQFTEEEVRAICNVKGEVKL